MNENFHKERRPGVPGDNNERRQGPLDGCGNHEALIGFLYGECSAEEREAVAVHVARCVACADELQSLRSTRTMLAEWTPPEAALGFRITRETAPPEATVLRPAAWWRQPLPAWAQAAAALLIFAAGMTLGGARQGVAVPTPAAVVPATVAASGASAGPGAAPAVSRADLVRLEQRLLAMESARVQPASVRLAAASPAVDEAALLRRVEAMIAASEERQFDDIAAIGNALSSVERQRRLDLRVVEDRLGRMHDTTRVELGRQNDALSYVMTSLNSAGR
jgi:hypothetical protein